MRRFVLWPILILAAAGLAGAGAQAGSLPAVKYVGSRHAAPTVQRALDLVEPLVPEAVRRAETSLEMKLDPDRLEILLQDIPAGRGRTTYKMQVRGVSHPILLVSLEPLLRGDYHDADAVLLTLTHEMIHALIRQNIAHADYARLPEWFQEGVPHFLLGQSLDKMIEIAAIDYENPYAALGGFEGDRFALPEVTGGFFFQELDARLGRQGVRNFILGVVSARSIDGGFEAVALMDPEMSDEERILVAEEVWTGARQRAREQLETATREVAEAFFQCRELYNGGKQDNGLAAIACFENLMASYPGTYAAEVSMYWLAKCHFKRRSARRALEALDAFDGYRRTYGLLDDSRYYRILLYQELDMQAEWAEACRQYLELFPDGGAIEKVINIYNN